MKAALSIRDRRLTAVGIAAIVVLAIACYWPSLNGGFIWDDESLITGNDVIKSADGWYRTWIPGENIDYWPVTNDSFWVEWHLWGMKPTGYHVYNLLLHIANALLIWALLRQLAIPGAFLAALLFAVHPVNVESVAWIAQRKNTLSMLLFLISIWCYLKSDARRFDIRYWLSLFAFAAAMLSKGSVAVLPLVLLLIIWWQRGRIFKTDLLRIAPFFAIAAMLVSVNIWSQQHGGVEAIRSVTFAQRLAGSGAVVWFYLAKALVPIDLMFVYPQWEIETGNFLWWLPLLAAIALTALLFWQRQRAWCRAALFAWGYFCVALLPVMGFTDVYYMKYSLVADHYQYLALIGVVALLGAAWNAGRHAASINIRRVTMGITAAALAALALLTVQQSDLYRSPIALYEDTLKKNPSSWLAETNLGKILNDIDQPAAAEKHLQAAARLNPNHVEIHLNLGTAAVKQRKLDEAIRHYEDAIRVDSKYPEAHFNLATAFQSAGRLPEAIEQFQEAVNMEPDYIDAHLGLASAYSTAGQSAEATAEFEKVVKLRPEFAFGHFLFGNSLLTSGQFQKAIQQFREALKLDDADARFHNSLGAALQSIGNHDEAAIEFFQATQLQSDYVDAWGNLAAALDQLHRRQEAIAAAETALRLAREQGKSELVKELEAWLQARRGENKSE